MSPTTLGSVKDVSLEDLALCYTVLRYLGNAGDMQIGGCGHLFEAAKIVAMMVVDRREGRD